MTIHDSYWSAEPPTKPGWYAWKRDQTSHVTLAILDAADITTLGQTPRLWCRLVPAQEVENAWQECCALGHKYDGDIPEGTFLHSRASKVMEGTL